MSTQPKGIKRGAELFVEQRPWNKRDTFDAGRKAWHRGTSREGIYYRDPDKTAIWQAGWDHEESKFGKKARRM